MKDVPGSNCTVQYVPRVIATKYFIKTFLKDYSAPEIAKFLSIWGTMKAILYRSKVKKAIKRIREHVFNKLKQDKKWNSKNNKFPQDVNVTMFDPGRSSLYKKLSIVAFITHPILNSILIQRERNSKIQQSIETRPFLKYEKK